MLSAISEPVPDDQTIQRVALLVDYPVLLRTIRAQAPDATPRLADMVRRAMVLGAVFCARAYGAWYDLEEASRAFAEGIDPVFVPPAGPGNAPTTTALVADGLAMICNGQVNAFALSGDDRLLPLMAAAHAEGMPVALVAHSCLPDGPSLRLAELAEPATAYGRSITRTERYRRARPSA